MLGWRLGGKDKAASSPRRIDVEVRLASAFCTRSVAMTSNPRARYSVGQLAPITPVPTTAIRRTGLLKDMNLRNLVGSKRDTQTGKEYIRRALVPRHLSSERVPDVL